MAKKIEGLTEAQAAIVEKNAVDGQNITPNDIEAQDELRLATQPLTGAIIDNAIEAGMVDLGKAFEELEQRIEADNGKAYPINAVLPDGVTETGNLVVVNRFAFIQSRVLESVVDAIDYQREGAKRRLDDNVKSLQTARRMVNEGRSALTEADLERKLSFVETQEEQLFLLDRAFKAAETSYQLATGLDYIRRADRQAMAQARRMASAPAPRPNRFA